MVHFTPELSAFLREHASDDPVRLLLSASRYPDVDVRWVAGQLEAHRQIRTKLPEWYQMADRLMFGGHVPAEQCSSEQTARYKRQLVVGQSLCDLTGGMGVDLYYMSEGLERAVYTERQPELCEAARHNFGVLGRRNITVREGDAFQLGIPDVDTLYLDPARRATDGSRVYDLADCEPNVVGKSDELLRHCRRLIIKLSPMADLNRVVQQLPGIAELHVVAVRNECKELLAVIDNGWMPESVGVHCVDFRSSDTVSFSFSMADESQAQSVYATAPGRYLYEPDVTLLKAGAFRLPCERYGLQKLDPNSHLYVSDRQVSDFPGRIFEIEEIMNFSAKNIRELKKNIGQANVATRNFPLSADELRKRSGLKDGGSTYLFGSVQQGMGALLFRCRKCLLLLICLLLLLPAPASAKRRKKAPEPTVEEMLQGIRLQSPALWNQGMEFVYLPERINASMVAENPSEVPDTAALYANTLWTFQGIVSEEDWMGQQIMHLRFRNPKGSIFRLATGRTLSQLNDTAYHPALPGLLALEPIVQCNERLQGKTFYLMLNDERILAPDTVRLEKFLPVVIDSVTVGTELAPLRVWFTHPKQGRASLLTSLPDSRETSTSTPIQRFFSATDPYRKYPDIKPEIWELICQNMVRQGMSLEECRLALGRPQRYERYPSKVGFVERWHYSDRKVLEFVDGHLLRIAIER